MAELLVELDKNAHAQLLPPQMYSVDLVLTHCWIKFLWGGDASYPSVFL